MLFCSVNSEFITFRMFINQFSCPRNVPFHLLQHFSLCAKMIMSLFTSAKLAIYFLHVAGPSCDLKSCFFPVCASCLNFFLCSCYLFSPFFDLLNGCLHFDYFINLFLQTLCFELTTVANLGF